MVCVMVCVCVVCVYVCVMLCAYVCGPRGTKLYIKVSEGMASNMASKPAATAAKEDFQFQEPDDSTSKGMELLDPHLPSLSQYWLGALRDHAYLSLPVQYGSQLPSGMFYTAEVSESVKPYYAGNWTSLLLAAATWLESTGFKEEGGATLVPGAMQQPLLPSSMVPSSPQPPHDPRQDQFCLVLGLAIQALCTPATLDCPQVALHCLQSLKRLLGARYAQAGLTSDPQLSIEVIGVLHRLMITCQSPDMQLVTMEIALLVGESLEGAAKSPHASADAARGKKPFCQEDCLDPGKSCTYGLLQVAASFLLRVVEGLRPKGSDAVHLAVAVGGAGPAHHQGTLLSMTQIAVKLLVLAAGCCAPPTCAIVLPLVLHMLLAVLSHGCRSGEEALTLSCLQCLQKLCGQLPLGDEKVVGLLRSCLASVMVEEPSASYPMSGEMKLSVMAVLLLVPAAVCPPGSELFGACVKLFESCISGGDSKVGRGGGGGVKGYSFLHYSYVECVCGCI